jgi:hypothetical protein
MAHAHRVSGVRGTVVVVGGNEVSTRSWPREHLPTW